MKDLSKEEGKLGEGELSTESLWKDFEDWSRTMWQDYSRIDQEMDRRFRDFSELMNKNRQRMLEEFKRDFQQRPALTSGVGQQQLTS